MRSPRRSHRPLYTEFACVLPPTPTKLDMDVITIHGGRPLRGAVTASGSKNAALALMAATILADEPIALANMPEVTDVNAMALALGYVGVEAKRDVDGRMHFSTVDPRAVTAGPELVSRMRAGFCILGPLLARRGRFERAPVRAHWRPVCAVRAA